MSTKANIPGMSDVTIRFEYGMEHQDEAVKGSVRLALNPVTHSWGGEVNFTIGSKQWGYWSLSSTPDLALRILCHKMRPADDNYLGL
jgi:hypothetical protein